MKYFTIFYVPICLYFQNLTEQLPYFSVYKRYFLLSERAGAGYITKVSNTLLKFELQEDIFL